MRNRLLFFALMIPNFAWSQTWSEFQAVNPAFPCQDGWMGCVQEGTTVQPELQKDSLGLPLPADLRIGWFDLAPTSNFTPFSSLSSYPEGPVKHIQKEEPVQVAVVPDPDADPTEAGGTVGSTTTNDGTADVGYRDPEAERARIEAEQKRLEEAEMRRAEQRAAEEAARARREEERRNREADERARAATRAMELVNKASNEADRARLRAEADRAEADRKRAANAAKEAAKMRKERERQEAEKKRATEAAAASARRAEADRKQKEAEEVRKAEAQRKAEAARRQEAEARAKKAADAARLEAEKADTARVAEAARMAKIAAEKAAAARNEADRKRLEEEQRRLAEEQKKATAEAKRKAEAAAKKAAEESRRQAEAEEKARQEERAKAQKADLERVRAEEAAKLAAEKSEKEGEGTEQVVAAGECSDLIQLEAKAVLGRLDKGTITCLEDRLKASTRQTEKGKISRLLMGNAFATDKTEWERLMKRHLEQIDQSDPDLCYKYALRLVKKGPGSAFQVIKWADIALENRAVWTGSTYQTRVYSLYKVRTVAANKIWQNYENKHAANPTDESNEKVKDARNRTKVYAREWYEYAKAADKDVTDALNTCQSAAGTKKYCEAG